MTGGEKKQGKPKRRRKVMVNLSNCRLRCFPPDRMCFNARIQRNGNVATAGHHVMRNPYALHMVWTHTVIPGIASVAVEILSKRALERL
eukprot:761600-Rhodomonas_salina.1